MLDTQRGQEVGQGSTSATTRTIDARKIGSSTTHQSSHTGGIHKTQHHHLHARSICCFFPHSRCNRNHPHPFPPSRPNTYTSRTPIIKQSETLQSHFHTTLIHTTYPNPKIAIPHALPIITTPQRHHAQRPLRSRETHVESPHASRLVVWTKNTPYTPRGIEGGRSW
jgi:hypothetical protein